MVAAIVMVVAMADLAHATCATPDAPPAPRPLRFVSFNVLHGGLTSELWGNADDLDDRLALATQELAALDADVIGLQEASRGRRRGDTTSRLAAALGYHYVEAGATSRLFGGSLLGWLTAKVLGFDEGPAILSRYPITATRTALLAQCGAFYRRVLLCAEVCTPWGPVEACSTHLSGSRCHAKSVETTLRSAETDAPIVLMGDLNATEDSPGLTLLRTDGGFVDTFRSANPTEPGFTDDQEIDEEAATAQERVDYVLVTPAHGRTTRVLDSRVVLDRPMRTEDGDVLWPSDHYGVLSDVDVFGRASVAAVSR